MESWRLALAGAHGTGAALADEPDGSRPETHPADLRALPGLLLGQQHALPWPSPARRADPYVRPHGPCQHLHADRRHLHPDRLDLARPALAVGSARPGLVLGRARHHDPADLR